MGNLRINGIVSIANRIRRSIGAPLTPIQRSQLDVQVREALAQIETILQQNRATARQLPPPSRRAYEYLRQVSLRPTETMPLLQHDEAQPAALREETIRFPGLRSFLTGLLDDLASGVATGRLKPEASLLVIQSTARRLDQLVSRHSFESSHLKPEARLLLAWFRYFSTPAGFHQYLEGLGRTQQVLVPLLSVRPRWTQPFLVHFRPSRLLFSVQAHKSSTHVILDTPMLTFDAATLQLLARRILGESRHQEELMAAMMSAPYQQMRTALELASGETERTGGLVHDLAESFERVNREYFQGQIARPRLSWSRTLTGRKFGHYDFVHDQVCISSTLDSPEVPAYVVDQVMHHELLHKKLGLRFHGSRQHAHTPEFREAERRFARYADADAFLNKLSRALM